MENVLEVIGIGRSQGEFEGRAYDNVIVHCRYADKKISGFGVFREKVGIAVFQNYPVSVGDKIEFLYNSYKRVTKIEIL